MQKEKITILGAGLVGSLLAIFLAKKGYAVDIYEQRSDMRQVKISAGRSINLALANRGIYALEQIGLMPQINKLLLPMRGRMLHLRDSNSQFSAYGQRKEEVIYSVSRAALNCLLMDAAQATGQVKIIFNSKCTEIDFASNIIYINNKKINYQRLVAADGSNSSIRKYLMQQSHPKQNEFAQLGHSYKELAIGPINDNEHAMQPDALHIWPRGEFMLIALPNIGGSFTVTLFFPDQGDISFASLKNKIDLENFFNTYFTDAVPLLTNYQEDFFNNPTGNLATVRCDPWHYKDRVLLIGDAAHAMVPFHGQGMNCGFEDCVALDQCLEQYTNWQDIFQQFQLQRKPNSDAIADMALENYIEMRSSVEDEKFHLKKQIAFKLEKLYPHKFIPRYSMVMFHCNPYHDAQNKGLIQNKILNELSKHINNINQLDLELADKLVGGVVR
jgi:kynurenine 3-monooxygenase